MQANARTRSPEGRLLNVPNAVTTKTEQNFRPAFLPFPSGNGEHHYGVSSAIPDKFFSQFPQ
jgi:hypothetical protein